MALKNYIKESYNELVNKVSWPTWQELQSSSVIVMVASIIIALIVWLMDFGFSHLMQDVVYNVLG
ncbi:MAG: preprotein translocase subunit SecE [Bacteroidales bacterium]|nr:preprotein translocase subunit SecE [Bacteroidales bacterium]